MIGRQKGRAYVGIFEAHRNFIARLQIGAHGCNSEALKHTPEPLISLKSNRDREG